MRKDVIRDFDPCAGTLVIRPPTLNHPGKPWNKAKTQARVELRKPHQKLIAALAIRRIIEFVTPNENLPPIGNLDNVVYWLFPELNPEQPPPRPTSFSIGGVHFEPVVGPTSVKWFLSRAPYPSTQPTPDSWMDWRECVASIPVKRRFEKDPTWSGWRRFPFTKLWDGRYWVQIHSLVPDRFHIRPFSPEHAKAFRTALPPEQRERLEAVLKHYAPGKVRYTLPGIYAAEMDGEFVKSSVKNMTLLALPTLDIHVPGLKKWLRYEVSYKKIDLGLLERRRRGAKRRLVGFQPAYSTSRRLRSKREQRGRLAAVA